MPLSASLTTRTENTPTGLRLFALGATRALGERVAKRLAVSLAEHEEREFEDGQHKARPLVSVRGCDVFVLHSLHGDDEQSVNDKLCRLLFFLGAVRDASAASVTAVVPFLCYGRKDRKTKPRDPVTTRYVAALFEAMQVDRVVTLDVHNIAAYQNAFRCRTEHLEARPVFVEYLAGALDDGPVAVVSPDVGGAKRAKRFRDALEVRLARPVSGALVEKHRSQDVVSGELLAGDVADKTVILIDDMISTGGTLARAARTCRDAGARAVWAVAGHPVFTEDADQVLAEPTLDRVITLDTVPPDRIRSDGVRRKLVQLDASELFAAAIHALHRNESVVALIER
jgi:ribose-phosphate pyrophosphokinase